MFSAICPGTCRHYPREVESAWASVHPLSSPLSFSFFFSSRRYAFHFISFSFGFPQNSLAVYLRPRYILLLTIYLSLSLSFFLLISNFLFSLCLSSHVFLPVFHFPSSICPSTSRWCVPVITIYQGTILRGKIQIVRNEIYRITVDASARGLY